MTVKIEGLDDAIRVMNSFPGDTRHAQRALVLQVARRGRRAMQKDVRAAAPERSGALKRAIGVRIDKSPPSIVVRGTRALVPTNAETGWLSRAMSTVEGRLANQTVQTLLRRIRRIQSGTPRFR